MRAIRHVALNAFRESVRGRVLYGLAAFTALLAGASYLVGQLTAGQDLKIIKDLGLAAIATFGLLIAVFIGIGLVYNDVERRSIYGILSKPIRRHEFIAGKYAGLALTLAVNVVAMTGVFYVVLAYQDAQLAQPARLAAAAPALDPRLLAAIALIFVELLLVTAIALFFSTFSSPLLSAALTLGLWVTGHFSADLRAIQDVVDSPVAAGLARALSYLLPNFAAFDIKAQVVHALPVPWSYLAITAAYGAVYVAFVVTAAAVVFARRDLT